MRSSEGTKLHRFSVYNRQRSDYTVPDHKTNRKAAVGRDVPEYGEHRGGIIENGQEGITDTIESA